MAKYISGVRQPVLGFPVSMQNSIKSDRGRPPNAIGELCYSISRVRSTLCSETHRGGTAKRPVSETAATILYNF